MTPMLFVFMVFICKIDQDRQTDRATFWAPVGQKHCNQYKIYFQVKDLIKAHINVGVQSASRLNTGPEVQGLKPVLVTFENFKDKEDVFQASKLLRKSVISVTEDLSKKTREARQGMYIIYTNQK